MDFYTEQVYQWFCNCFFYDVVLDLIDQGIKRQSLAELLKTIVAFGYKGNVPALYMNLLGEVMRGIDFEAIVIALEKEQESIVPEG